MKRIISNFIQKINIQIDTIIHWIESEMFRTAVRERNLTQYNTLLYTYQSMII